MTQVQLIQAELESWEAETGQPLPMPAAEIARIEASGRYVDLATGAIVNPRVYLQTSIEVAGEDAGAIAQGLQTAVNVGALDLAIVNLLRGDGSAAKVQL